MNLSFLQIIDRLLGWILVAVFKPVVGIVGLLLRRDHDLKKDVKHIAVLKMKGGGSVLLAGPSLISIRNKFPDACITLISTEGVSKFGRLLPVFNRYFVINDTNLWTLCYSSISVLFACWRNPINILIDLEVYSKLTGIFSVFTLALNRIGFFLNETYFRKGIYTHLLFLNQNRGIYFFYDGISKLLGCSEIDLVEYRKKIITSLPKKRIDTVDNSAYCVIAPFCSELAQTRMWPMENWTKLLLMLVEKNPSCLICIIGTDTDKSNAEILLSEIPKTYHDRIKILCGNLSLLELCCLLKDCSLFVGIDSGPLHLARLYGTCVVSLWGATDPQTRLRRMPGIVEAIIYGKTMCSPCVHVAEESPCSADNQCMKIINIQQVYGVSMLILEGNADGLNYYCIENNETGIWTVLSRPFSM